MSNEPVCQTCGTALTSGSSPSGLCPSCLFAQVLSDPGEGDPLDDELSSGLEPGADFGRFRIEGRLGKGGMSTVYRAYEPELDRTVALKILPAEFLHDETFAQRFRQEARVVAALEHPHIVPLYASGIDDGLPWMSMRLFAGGNLGTLLIDGPIDVERTLAVLRAVGSALDYAHTRGVVHRDVKPSNILLDDTGGVCIGDFGLAHVMERSLVHTRTGVTAGSPHYMAPEQGLGRPVDAQADVYGLGCVAYEMLTGHPPFDGPSPVAVVMKHVNERPSVPPRDQVPASVWKVLEKALDKDPAHRWRTATVFVDAMERGLAEGVAPGHSRRTNWAIGLAAAAVVLAIWGAQTWRRPPSQEIAALHADAIVPDGVILQPPTLPQPEPIAPPPAPPAIQRERREPPGPPREAPLETPALLDALVGQGRDSDGAVAIGNEAPAVRPADGAVPVDGTRGRPGPAGGAPPEAPEVAGQRRPAASPPTVAIADVQPQLLRESRVDPDWRLNLRRFYEGKSVVVEATIDADGRVTDVEVLKSPDPALDEAARNAVRRWRFTPGRRNGKPAEFQWRTELTVGR